MQFKKVYVEITNKCNLSCDFCIKNKRLNKEITIDEFNTLLNKLKPYTKYLYFHVLGEPLMHKNINKLIDIASKHLFVNITTNGYLINRIKDNKNIRQVNISLHSYNDKYKITLDDYLNNIFDTIDNLILNKTYVSLRLWVKTKDKDQIIDKINQRYNTTINLDKNSYKIKDYLFINNNKTFIWPDLNNDYYNEVGTCYGLIDHIGVLVDGTIVPCCLDTLGTVNLGNIYKNNLEDVFSHKRVINMIEGFKNNKKCEELCKHCNFLDKKS